MKKYLIYTLMLLMLPTAAFSTIPDSLRVSFEQLEPEPQHKRVSQLITYILNKNHYRKRDINDSLSSEIFDRYIESLDPARMYFLESDMIAFEKYRYQLDENLEAGNVSPAFEIFNVYEKRLAQRLEFIYQRLETEFDYSIDEYFDTDREDDGWARSPEELDDLWRKRIKHDALNLKIAGKTWAEIQKNLRKRYKRIQKNASQFQSEDVFQVYMNAFSETFDPHTNYFSPKNFDDFKIQMSKSLEGIGARLQTDNDYTKVVEIVPGGPADKSKLLFPNDRIMSVAQEDNGEFVDILGWRIDDVVQLIRGKKGSTVRLEILRAGEPEGTAADTIALVRDKIKLVDQVAKSDTLILQDNNRQYKFGVIDIPSFYYDYDGARKGDPNFSSTSRDVKKLLQELMQQNIDGVIIDLRRNGGGYLNEAVDLTGLFIKEGPVVQVRSSTGKLGVEYDTDVSVVYEGPLVVLVDRFSASASEIFAAAIQDYGRGIIIGSQSFGKGTVQNPIDLNRFMRSENTLGQVKITTAKFYRINGESTQHVGVIPDLKFPTRYELMDIGESSQPNALLWDHIEPVSFYKTGEISKEIITRLQQQHAARLAGNPKYKELLKDLDDFKDKRDKKLISLNEDKRRAERAKNETAEEDEETVEEHPVIEENKKHKDLMLMESAHVLGDYIKIVTG